MKNLKGITKVTIRDYSNYNSSTCNNGGDYAFFTYFDRVSVDNFKQTHESSADFEYCPYGQGFQRCEDCSLNNSQDCCPDKVSENDLLNIVSKFKPEEIQVNDNEITITIPEEE